MYTQCPECGVAFRVTAEVLKMAAGKVRCGGCGVPFNALDHLSESKPIARSEPEEPSDSESHQASPIELQEPDAETTTESTPADQSSALLKALDELAGEDIRIEDTGVEWRIIDEHKVDWDNESAPEPDHPELPADEPPRAIDEMLFDDNTVLPDDFDAFVEAPSTPKPVEPVETEEPELPQFDLDLSDPDEWDDLLGELEVTSEDLEAEPVETFEADEPLEGIGPELEADFGPEVEPEPEPEPEDEDEAEDEDEDEDEPEPGPEDEDELERSIEEDLLAAAFESEAAARSSRNQALDDAADEAADIEADDLPIDDVEIDIQIDDEAETEDDVEDIAMPFDDTVEEDIATLSMSMNQDPFGEEVDDERPANDEPGEDSDNSDESGSGEHVIPELTEEEMTINMLIDQDLLNIAIEDEDGFASTIVQLQPDDKVEKEIADKDSGKRSKQKNKDAASEEPRPDMTVETIIMEGEFVRSGGDDVSLALNREKDDYELRREMDGKSPRVGMYAGLAALVLVLLLQVIHQSRDALASVPAFTSAVGPVYRMLGMPLTPAWNISGWRFEATRGDTDENGEILTIYSRVGNNSDDPLPFPLVHLSLTDRFEDIIGSTVLEPAEYLPESADPRTLVPPGNTFNAVIAIDSPSPDATGFKLNVCYRLASGQLRCPDHDFK